MPVTYAATVLNWWAALLRYLLTVRKKKEKKTSGRIGVSGPSFELRSATAAASSPNGIVFDNWHETKPGIKIGEQW
jgi:hypothetical protein